MAEQDFRDLVLMGALTQLIIPALPEAKRIPETDWIGWAPLLAAVGADAGSERAAAAVERARRALSRLLGMVPLQLQQQKGRADERGEGFDHKVTEMEQQQQLEEEEQIDPESQEQQQQQQQQQRKRKGKERPDRDGSPPPFAASQLPLTQLLGSAADEAVLLGEPPPAVILAKARMPRKGRLVRTHNRAAPHHLPTATHP
ncbi:hypothetical protein MNEG_7154 [Monoraphidium neglectum]|uniref:Uncharacterized protein n=1 Tax=Monoraphidium neglectum TaxID=145388 RepID=A0A0D2MJK7_9CHLO|nr:hypothetical protein MNEG_7154 [Monoraphidium neglectum]KIZ00807.1 hypothetical protein MNEG_7154 [Monoraphidium neglectum]|eukprot:XP_013899826.1 hypothetical protein MNEG_7154 [Monoraphidium neglectum]